MYFLVSVAVLLVIGVPRIRRNVFLPRDLQFQEVPSEKLTPAQLSFLKPYDDQLTDLQFRTFKTFRVPNLLGHNLVRVYLNSADPAKCALTMVAAKNKSLFTSYVEFATHYADGTHLTVNNNRRIGLFDPPPWVITDRNPGLNDMAELKSRHDKKAQGLLQRGVVFYTPDNYFEDLQQYHRKSCEYQESKGLLRWDDRARVYRATTWTALRGVISHLNPFADRNFSIRRLLFGLAIGGGLPVTVTLERVPLSVWLLSHAGAYGPLASSLVPLVAYTIGGIAIGILFSRRIFIWGLLLGVLPSRLLFGGLAGVGYSLWMASLADLVGRAHNRRKNIL